MAATHAHASAGAARGPLRRTLALVTALLLATLTGSAGLLLWQRFVEARVLFPVRDVKVEGALRRVDREALRATVTRHLAPGLLQVDMDRLRAAVTGLAWVESASVRRLLPGTLLISVQEHQPVARWNRSALLGRDGSVFAEGSGAAFGELPSLVGPPGLQRALHGTFQRLRPFFSALGLQLAEVSLDRRRSWRLVLSHGVELVLGREAVEARLRRFATLYRRALERDWLRVARVDLRYTNGLAVRWRAQSSAPAAESERS